MLLQNVLRHQKNLVHEENHEEEEESYEKIEEKLLEEIADYDVPVHSGDSAVSDVLLLHGEPHPLGRVFEREFFQNEREEGENVVQEIEFLDFLPQGLEEGVEPRVRRTQPPDVLVIQIKGADVASERIQTRTFVFLGESFLEIFD